jgi:hypothetical protein
MYASPEVVFHLIQLRLQPLANRLPPHRKVAVALLLPADMREAKKTERLRLPFFTPLSVLGRERSKLQKPRLFGMQFQTKFPKPLDKFHSKLFGICVPHGDHIAVRLFSTPGLCPQIEDVM